MVMKIISTKASVLPRPQLRLNETGRRVASTGAVCLTTVSMAGSF
jgi:hypothetical protein